MAESRKKRGTSVADILSEETWLKGVKPPARLRNGQPCRSSDPEAYFFTLPGAVWHTYPGTKRYEPFKRLYTVWILKS